MNYTARVFTCVRVFMKITVIKGQDMEWER